MNRFKTFLIIVACFSVLLITGCENGEDKDWTKEIMVTVASKKVDFYPFINIGIPSEGISVKEDNANHWSSFPLEFIEGFTYEEGYEYRLKVQKIHLVNPPEDGFIFNYKLIVIVSKKIIY
jgi:hypothetical protein